MKILCFTITYSPITLKGKVKAAYDSKSDKQDKREAAYWAYRDLTGASIQESHKAVRPWLKKWEG
jgi:hypothetical protein